MPEDPSSSTNLRKACDSCHDSKVKCVLPGSSSSSTNSSQCQRCVRLGISCTFSPPDVGTAPRKRKRGNENTSDAATEPAVSPTYHSSGNSQASTSSAWDPPGAHSHNIFTTGFDMHDASAMPSMDQLFMSNNAQFDPSVLFMPQSGLLPNSSLAASPRDTSPTPIVPIHPPGDDPQSMVQDYFMQLTNLSCTLHTFQGVTPYCPPPIASLEQGIATLSSFWDQINSLSHQPPPASVPSPGSPASMYIHPHSHQTSASVYVGPNVVMLSFSVVFQLISCLHYLSANQTLSNTPELLQVSKYLTVEDQTKIMDVVLGAQLRKLREIMEMIEDVTHRMHQDGSQPCFIRMMAAHLKTRCESEVARSCAATAVALAG